jgi:serine/threonine protein kinase
LSAFLTNITGHKRLFKLGIYHCDISDGNLMFHRRNGHTFGILIDFDLAVITNLHSENQHRTGTRQFMAIELLEAEGPVMRHYKHDAESFFWVVVYDTTLNSLVNGWGLLTNLGVVEKKIHYLRSGTRALPMKETYPPIVSWVNGVRKFLSSTDTTEKDWGIDELYSTLRGFRDDQGDTLATHIETRQKCYAPATS